MKKLSFILLAVLCMVSLNELSAQNTEIDNNRGTSILLQLGGPEGYGGHVDVKIKEKFSVNAGLGPGW